VAFDRGDVQHARALLEDVRREGALAWMLESTIDDLADSAQQQSDPTVRRGLGEVLAGLTELLPKAVPADS
jgi:hypothetical protein